MGKRYITITEPSYCIFFISKMHGTPQENNVPIESNIFVDKLSGNPTKYNVTLAVVFTESVVVSSDEGLKL